MDVRSQDIPTNIRELRRAMEQDEFRLYYQPKVNLTSGSITGVDALIRWKHPAKGLFYPNEFIPAAETSEFIVELGDWILRMACTQNRAWQDEGRSPFIVAVNVSGRQLHQPHFAERVERIVHETGLDPRYLELKIRENTVMDPRRVLPVLRDLKKTGVRLGLDAFGIGYSCLFWLKEYPIDVVKIDRSFVKQCTVHQKDATIVKAIIAMAHELSVQVVAEGIESKEQLIFLQQNLCDGGQGYLFSPPLPAKTIVRRFEVVERVVSTYGIPEVLDQQIWLNEAIEKVRQESTEILRYQQGMTFKFIRQDGQFIHTFCAGELLYRLGLSPELVLGKSPHDVLPHDDAERKLQYYRRAWEGEENVSYEMTLNDLWYLASLRPIRRGGEIVEVIGSCVDITDRKEAERKLRESEEKYRLIAENMQDLIGILDTTGTVKYASPSLETVLGFKPTEFEGNSVFNWVHPDELPYVQQRFAQIIATKQPCRVELRYRHVHGHWVDVEAYGSPVLDDTGEINHAIVVARDITKRKESEELVRRTEKLSIAGQLAAGVAHEIRNPLTALKGFTQLLKTQSDPPTYVDTMLSEIQALESIIEEFLALAKPQSPKMKETDMVRLVRQMVLLFRTQGNLRNVEIVERYAIELPRVYCNENQIKQVVVNVLQNAVEAMPNGGTLSVELLQTDAHSIKIRVMDQGHGMSEKRLKHLGEPFYSSKEKGTGLGLTVSYKIIQQHGGAIHIQSVVNQGTTVEITLPISKA